MNVDGVVNETLWKKLIHCYEKITSKEDSVKRVGCTNSHHHHVKS